MQMDLLQKELFPATEATPASSKKSRPANAASPSPKTPSLDITQPLPPLPDSLMALVNDPQHIDPDTLKDTQNKAPSAFKTISEAARLLNVPQHVLRFWESRFSQIKPVKSRGGRRYYRPEDMEILTTIQHLLYKQGYTIKGAKKAFSIQKKNVIEEVRKSEKSPKSQAVAAKSAKPILDHKKQSQLSVIRQELIGLRETLKLHI